MLNFTRVVKILSIAVCIGTAMPVFAESAPVYDVDAIQQQNPDDGSDQAQYLPPPPPPGQDGGGGFVPMQQQPIAAAAPSESSSLPLNMEQRVMRVEQQINNMQTSDTGTRVESLQGQVQALRGQIEQLTHQLEQLQNQQKTMYSDLDSRLGPSNNQSKLPSASPPPSATTDGGSGAQSALNSGKPAKSAAVKPPKPALIERLSSKPAGTQPNVAEEQQIYQTAYNLIKAKKYSEAVTALQNMLKKYPSGQFASNAHYWLGELYGLMGKPDLALAEFGAVVQAYPDSPRVSDAQLKVGLIYASELKWPDAKAALKKVINRYPGSASARLASEQLKQIKQAGH